MHGMPTLLDTHAWVWWVTEDRRLSNKASAAIRNAVRSEGVWLSLISIWEALAVTGLQLLELTPAILLDSGELPPPFHGDPADQMIVASARQHRASLVTGDRNLRRYPHVQTIW